MQKQESSTHLGRKSKSSSFFYFSSYEKCGTSNSRTMGRTINQDNLPAKRPGSGHQGLSLRDLKSLNNPNILSEDPVSDPS